MSSSSACVSLVAPSLGATHAVARALASVSRAGDMIVLAGEMGAGKTAFAQGFGKALGVTEPITSPTFTLVHTYDTPTGPLHHADIYRLEQLAEVADLALSELAEFNGIVLVEWGDVVSSALGEHLEVRLDLVDDEDPTENAVDESRDDAIETPPTSRRIRVTASGPSWAKRWSLISDRLGSLDLTDSIPC
ncbi:MAG: tRNA (adenosine(37)-N6)-threonylcarbamoyltransferase complex ATPase subunit type 1 TsaE [Actinomycetota bacterium]|nr:tRNA (adenosine(37)-N6)-threonylcarbamoyltransferase complex ATPase subunit type 1 TsaE [Actinomycetota bacterium]